MKQFNSLIQNSKISKKIRSNIENIQINLNELNKPNSFINDLKSGGIDMRRGGDDDDNENVDEGGEVEEDKEKMIRYFEKFEISPISIDLNLQNITTMFPQLGLNSFSGTVKLNKYVHQNSLLNFNFLKNEMKHFYTSKLIQAIGKAVLENFSSRKISKIFSSNGVEYRVRFPRYFENRKIIIPYNHQLSLGNYLLRKLNHNNDICLNLSLLNDQKGYILVSNSHLFRIEKISNNFVPKVSEKFKINIVKGIKIINEGVLVKVIDSWFALKTNSIDDSLKLIEKINQYIM